MMRLGRRAMLLVAFSLLTSAATAYAECAWVMWQRIMTNNPASGGEDSWTPTDAFKNEDLCKSLAIKLDKGMSSKRDPSGYKYVSTVVCLPDTVDPRGPKGK